MKALANNMRGSDVMVEWLKLLGHSVQASVLQWHRSFSKIRSQIEDLNGLNVIRVAGTKGKACTCTFAVSFLKAHRSANGYPQKVGLYTSPHMMNIRERICINSEPTSKELSPHVFSKSGINCRTTLHSL